MLNLDPADWLAGGGAISSATAPARAALAWRRINDKPTSIVLKNLAGSPLAAQTVRLEFDNTDSAGASAAGAAPTMKLTIFGIRGHATLPDTNIGEGYRFNYLGDAYRVIDVIKTIGEIQGIAEATG
jgi:hypothetical protein